MGLFSKEETVFEENDIHMGEVDYTNVTGTGYSNVVTFAFSVKKGKAIRAKVKSDKPVDVVIAYEDNSMAGEKVGVTDDTVGPFQTKKCTNMGLILGIYPGDRANVSVRVWTDSK